MDQNYESEFSKEQGSGAGDRLFNAVGGFFSTLLSGRVKPTLNRLKESKIQELGLPPHIEQILHALSKKVHGKVEDIGELASELKDLALARGQDVTRNLINGLNLSTREDIDRLEARIEELLREKRSTSKTNSTSKVKSASSKGLASKIAEKR